MAGGKILLNGGGVTKEQGRECSSVGSASAWHTEVKRISDGKDLSETLESCCLSDRTILIDQERSQLPHMVQGEMVEW